MNSPYTVVFAGGGALGAWEVGCLQTLYQRFDGPPVSVAGASAGSLNAAGVALGLNPDKLAAHWQSLRRSDVLWPPSLWLAFPWTVAKIALPVSACSVARGLDSVPSLFSIAPLRRTIDDILGPFRYEWPDLKANLVFSVSNLRTQRRGYLYRSCGDFSPPANGVWQRLETFDQLLDGLLASAAIPLVFPLVNGLSDGGVFRNHPFGCCLVKDFSEGPVFVLSPTPESCPEVLGLRRTVDSLIASWTGAGLQFQVETAKVQHEQKRKRKLAIQPVCLIYAERDIKEAFGVSLLSFGKNVERVIEAGRRAAETRLGIFREGDPATWFSGDAGCAQCNPVRAGWELGR